MTTLSVVQITGPHCGTHVEGAQLYRTIEPLLKNHEHIMLNFGGITVASSSFFNGLFRPITDTYGRQHLVDHLSYTDLAPRHRFVLEHTQQLWLPRV